MKIVDTIVKCFLSGNKVLICGNGGSLAESSHFAAELVGKFKLERRALPAIALTSPEIITAIGNDYTFDNVFSRQVEAYGEPGDVLICLSTSGKSKNVLKAIKTAKSKGLEVIDFPRKGKDTPSVQEFQLNLNHMKKQ